MPLTDTAIRNARPSPKPFKRFDERGLFLIVTPFGGKWELRQEGKAGYKLVMIEDDEMPQEAITSSGLTNWPAERVIFICFVKVDQQLPRSS